LPQRTQGWFGDSSAARGSPKPPRAPPRLRVSSARQFEPAPVQSGFPHFTPTSASWLNAIEGFFAKLTKQRLKRGVFHSLVALQAAIKRYLAETNDHPRPFQWTKDPDKIIAAIRRGHQALDSLH
jgi:hypothetical protein